MNRFSRLFTLSALTLAACGAASATPIAAGGSVNPATMLQIGSLTQVALYNNVAFASGNGTMPSTFTGTYSEGVFRDTANTLCSTPGQCLTFIIQVNNSSSSSDGIETVTTGPFSSLFTYNVGYNSANGGVAPLNITDSAFGAIAYNFTAAGNQANILKPGSSSDYLIIETSATAFTAGNISFQDSQTATVAGYLPTVAAVAVTPEPSSLVLLGTGFIGAATTMLRRRKLFASAR